MTNADCSGEVRRLQLGRRSSRSHLHDRGSMSIEAVLLAPILMMLVLFVVHLGRLATTHLRLITVADQSARAASLVHPRFMATVGESVARENAELNELPCAALDVGVEVTYDTDPATVRVSLSCDLTLNGVAMLAPVARTVAATSVEVIDRWRVDE